jgi:hypothetical protein
MVVTILGGLAVAQTSMSVLLTPVALALTFYFLFCVVTWP